VLARPVFVWCEDGGVGNRWDERYRSGEWDDKEPEGALVRFAANMQPGVALDVACGLGRNSVWLAEQGWGVTAVDYSEVALGMLRMRVHGTVRIVRADLERGEFNIAPDTYDLICCCNFLHRPLFEPMRCGVLPGGLFVGVFPLSGDDAAPRPTNPAYLIEPGELLQVVEGWEVLHSFEGRPDGDPARRLRAEVVARRPL
jgi:SAM-dependent methyltransferase